MKKFTLGVLGLVAIVGGLVFFHMPSAHADFNQNNLISDSVFDDWDTMSAAQIDAWLNNNWPNSCISTRNGFSAPYPSGYSPSTGFTYASSATGGQVIAAAAQAYEINPQVILSTLEKESSVVTGNASYHCQYINTSMGFDCPDSGSCPQNPATESGFSQQVIHAAWLLKFTKERSEGNVNFNIQKPGWDNSDDPPACYAHLMTQGYRARSTSSSPCPTSSSPPGNQQIYYDGYTTIDGTTVHLDTGATAALYVYTPHFHGNQNFVSIFEQTFGFGSTRGVSNSWQVQSQNVYLDSGRTSLANTDMLAPNTTYYVQLKALNTGNIVWSNSGNNPVLLGTQNPTNHASIFCDNTWVSCSRPALMAESSVSPGQTGTFNFAIHTPNAYGNFREYYDLLSEGNMWMNDIGLYWQWNVRPPTANWGLVSQQLAADSSFTQPINSDALAPNTTYYLQVKALNTGNATWSNTGSFPTDLGTSSPLDRSSEFCDGSWLGCNRPSRLVESSVAPGQVGTFNFTIHTPSSYGVRKEYFRPVVEGSMWMNDLGMYWQFNVRQPVALWQYVGQGAYTDSSKSTPINISQLTNGTRFYASVTARNIGNTTWTNSGANPTNLGASSPLDRSSGFCDNATWPGCNRPAHLTESSVAPGQTGTFNFWMQAPYTNNGTNFTEYFRPVVEGSMWMNDLGLNWQIKMQSSLTSWQVVDQKAYTDSSHTTSADLTNATTNTTYYLQVKAKNTSGQTWYNSGSTPTNLGTSSPQDRMSGFCDSTWISCNRPTKLVESSVPPGQTGTFNFRIKTPGTATNVKEYFTPVVEGQAWLDDLGMYWQIVTH